MLETLCIAAIAEDAAMPCVEAFFQCLHKAGIAPRPIDRARLQAFLASRERPGLWLGLAARAGYFSWDAPALQAAKQFVKGIYGRPGYSSFL